jgi:ankyrin repeat protein
VRLSAWKSQGATVDRRDDSGYTPLHMAARAGQVDTLRSLLLAGADADIALSARPASSPLMPLPEGAQQESVSEHLLAVCSIHLHPRRICVDADSVAVSGRKMVGHWR